MCGGVGHRYEVCPSPKSDDKGKGSNSKPEPPVPRVRTGAAAAALESLDDIAGAWSATFVPAAIESDSDSASSGVIDPWSDDAMSDSTDLTKASDNDRDSMPDLQTVSDSSDGDVDSIPDLQTVSDSSLSASEADAPAMTAPAPEPVPLLERLSNVAEWLNRVFGEGCEDAPAPSAPSAAAALEPLAATAAVEPRPPVDLYDSSATHHMSPYREDFLTFQEIPPHDLTAANQQPFQATGVGDMLLPVPNDPAPSSNIRLRRVLYAPELRYNLVSVGRIDDAGFTTTFASGECVITDHNGATVGHIPKSHGLYIVEREHTEGGSAQAAVADEQLTIMELHRRLGHIAPRAIRELIAKGYITGVKIIPSDESLTCEACVHAKATRRPVPKEREGERSTSLGEEVHSDIWGPSRVISLGGRKYYISFTDDATRFTTLYLLRQKSEAFESFRGFVAWLKNQHDTNVKALNTDRGGEYLSDEFISFLEENGIQSKLSVHDTHGESGVSERLNRTIMEKVRAMLIASGLPRFLWGEAVMHAVYLKNRTSMKALGGRTPFEAATGKVPDVSGIPEWGCQVWVHDTASGKVGVRAQPARWVGFDHQSKGHRVFWPNRGATGTVTVERNITFSEDMPPPAVVDDDVILEGEQEPADDKSESSAEPSEPAPVEQPVPTTPALPPPTVVDLPPAQPEPPRQPRTRPPSRKVRDILEGKAADCALPRGVRAGAAPKVNTPKAAPELEEEISGAAMAAQMADTEGLDPRSLEEARRHPEWPRWEEAMLEELRALEAHGIWVLEAPPPGANIISCRWVFHAKKDAAGNVTRLRARLVARGFSQVPGVDFFDTYAPVAKTAVERA
ncbi:hypothetical protein GSI_09393 [Ganoderma sinense ZZ0214-1]|uniref:Integrase catalytic domain-containing protein n=1 Tax=Ganoderma sinense ZZ0214-1 TaxID=1077348 RepID=A0A2G8S6D8_9APHY|nr:hypothetical protein GSI_09393 [Ganoderma sinense ZZ0214-1]